MELRMMHTFWEGSETLLVKFNMWQFETSEIVRKYVLKHVLVLLIDTQVDERSAFLLV